MSKFYDYQGLLVEVIKHTAVITFDNPPAHTWTSQSLTSLRDLVLELNNDDDIYALVLTGGGDKFFSAGADLKIFADGDKKTAADMSDILVKHLKLYPTFGGSPLLL
jgi:enoyl-CoA hydratase/carnithine racemase